MCSRSTKINHAGDISQDLLSDKFDFVGGSCAGLLNIQFALLDRNLAWDVTTPWDHLRDAILQRDLNAKAITSEFS